MRAPYFIFLSLAVACSGLLAGGAGGCGSVLSTKEPGVFVPNLKGTYDLASVSSPCSEQFDSAVTIVQDEKNFSIRASTSGFTDLTGSVDINGALTFTGASDFGAPFECTGLFADSSITGVCNSQQIECVVDEGGVETCSTIDVSCAFTYQRI